MEKCTVLTHPNGKPARCKMREVSQGKRTADPRHPEKRHYDHIPVTVRCEGCGRVEIQEHCLWLLADLFSI